jgi:hypothetical protein
MMVTAKKLIYGKTASYGFVFQIDFPIIISAVSALPV